ncbi:MAG TPA: penicillin-binding protein 2 [Bryobacteraceae bacterium]|nr:penicillin-binding protein 2 [Bryobacteraceae bacterium]
MSLPPVSSEGYLRISDAVPVRDDTKIPSGRIALFQYTVVAVFVFLIAGFWALQIQNPEFYNEQAERNRIRSIPILAPRGKILDRDGRVIVDNHSSFTLILSRESLKPEHLRPIADGLQLDYDDLTAKLRRYGSRPKYEPMVVKEELSPADLAFVEAHRDYFPEMEVIHSQRRLYPQNGMAAQVIGYTGEVSEQELDSPEFGRYDPGDVIGKFGIERQYNDILMGTDGQRQALVDNRGREREVLGTKEAVPGKNLQLTLDLDLQAVAELVMEGRNGAVVALDPRNGEVLAMVSRPAFDPNKFAVRIKPADWKEIAQNPDHPLMNKAIQAQQAPGSTFKPMLALAGLESGSIDDEFTVRCGGGASFYGRYFKCHLKGGHGSVALHKGIAQSCDVYFYNVGNRTGIDNIARYVDQFGLGHKTGIDLPHESEGVVPSPQWKLRNFRQKWYAGETISVSIGQGALTVTPLQLARAIAGISQRGVWYTPHLLKSETGKLPTHTMKLDPKNIEDVISGMYAVVNEGGTGVRARIPGIEVCGKTGTAQLASNDYLKANRQHSMKDNAWFVGFAPRQAPEILVVALYENGEHGQFAASLVRDVMKAYFDKKARLTTELMRQRSDAAARVSSLTHFGMPAQAPPPEPAKPKAPEAAVMESAVPGAN